MLINYLTIALGGAFGAMLRFFISDMSIKLLGKGFPFGTLIVNILGSLLMGVLYGLIEKEVISVSPSKTLIGIGFLGALTTFSTFSMDSLLLLQQGQYVKMAFNVTLNVVACIFMAWVGLCLIMQKG
ncbi:MULTISPECIES: fluoride efflux transporter CrcB [Pseudoalteromonas]|uniref:Fluoride-specific ion channel FluC n=2 Tax=Pseudoalteromonas TaxID=53246 RepID=A0A8I2KNB0_9GAMM|nr:MULTISPECIES: fluoride efflux transporter CrcB [Pseudoalteromonas]KID34870.1 camphor resistance protein CrcB [Pseudoalteromonas flavipulchra NCIMB 2033 = ATCC BAA-314]KJY89172.1 camphor resistance protein CrcB [Pseudoalteromonas piscicida]MBD0784093.1 fluoride efflux transporter CrcB [Pseudoalteromonas flavipulchra]MBE0372918.1 CrcB protein [Pseudoalteromonas flavipulchra NCIMB 2033 = ATCC BAA-314]MBR8844788.1 fluoride efflux transporter CrcB [Pseudoalteromonas sp. JC3]